MRKMKLFKRQHKQAAQKNGINLRRNILEPTRLTTDRWTDGQTDKST